MSNKILDAIEIVVASKTTHQDIEFLQNFIYQSFIIGCRHFLKKRRLYQTTGTNQTLLFSAGIFAVVIFVCSLWHLSHMSLPYLSVDCVIFLLFFCFVCSYGCCCYLNSLTTLMENCHKSYSYISVIIFDRMGSSLDQRIH